MPWKKILAACCGEIEMTHMPVIDYLLEENQILRRQITGRINLSNEQRRTLAEKACAMGKLMADYVTIARPETILKWHRQLVARKFDGSKSRQTHGRPPIATDVEDLVLTMAKDNPSWGYDKIAGAICNLGHSISDTSVGNILAKHGIAPAPERKRTTTWKQFIKQHTDVLLATDFFTTEVWTKLVNNRTSVYQKNGV